MYDFKTLSSHDFELLTRDLLQEHLGIFLESFKAGRDQGIDLRHAPATDLSLIVQCKHYASTGFSGLLSTLRKEVSKVEKLNPKRYIVATSVELSPHNKADIAKLFSKYCTASTDVFGCDELNNLISKNNNIERQHFKLWMSSVTVLDNILHNELYNQTLMLVENIQNKIKLYVQNSSFYDTLDIIKDNNYCIISGIPGIGKTFLAEVLLIHHLNRGYEPVVVRSNISEAFKMLKPSSKQVFYFDDFLGQTGLEEKLEKNEEQSILDFIKYTQNHTHAKFILTTREYILQQARNMYEKLHAPEFDYAKCIINLNSYTRKDKAHILFNHIYFSKLPLDYKKSLTKKESIIKIVDHDNYSPRIIEWMADFQNIRDYSAIEYPDYFLRTLDHPDELWRHAFRNHLKPSSRSLLMVLMTFRFAVDKEDLREAYNSYRSIEMEIYGGAISQDDFRLSLDELDGSFIRCEKDNQSIFVTFHNPSVLDFLERYLSENSETLRNLCSSIIFYDQFLALCRLKGGKEEHEHIAKVLGKENLIPNAILATYSKTAQQRKIEKLRNGEFRCVKATQAGIEENIAHSLKITKYLPDSESYPVVRTLINDIITRVSNRLINAEKISKIINLSADNKKIASLRQELINVSVSYFEEITTDYEDEEQLNILSKFIQSAPSALSNEFINRVKSHIEENYEMIFDWKITDAASEYDIDECRDVVNLLEKSFNVDLSHVDDWIDDRANELQEEYDHSPDDWFDNHDEVDSDISDNDIVAIFDSLYE